MIRGEKQYLAAPLVLLKMTPNGKLLPLVIQVRRPGHPPPPAALCSPQPLLPGIQPLLLGSQAPSHRETFLLSLFACSLLSPDSPNWKFLFCSTITMAFWILTLYPLVLKHQRALQSLKGSLAYVAGSHRQTF